MPTILFRYVTKEVLMPAVVALLALTFIIFMSVEVPGGQDQRLFWMLLKMFFSEDIPNVDILAVIALVLPSTLLFIAPMALLIGIVIGIGRMTLDLETRAMQTSGIPIYIVFIPLMSLGAALSLFILFMSYAPEPMMLRASISRVSKLLIAEFSNLEAGRMYEDIFGEELGLNLYFEDRDPETNRMLGVTLMMDRDAVKERDSRRKRKLERDREEEAVEDLYEEGEISAQERDKLLYEIKVRYKEKNPIMIFAHEASFAAVPDRGIIELVLYDGTMHILDQRPEVEPEGEAVAGRGGSTVQSRRTSGTALPADSDRSRPMILLAQADGADDAALGPEVTSDAQPRYEGLRSVLPPEAAMGADAAEALKRTGSELERTGEVGEVEPEVLETVEEVAKDEVPADDAAPEAGAAFPPAPDAPPAQEARDRAEAIAGGDEQRDYMIISFDRFTKLESIVAIETHRTFPAMTVPQLWERSRDPEEKERYQLRAKASALSRYSLSMQAFVLAFLGLPLAVRVRPTGKSVGVLIAFALILVYHWLQRTGFAMVEAEHPLGGFVIFLPNLLFLLGGLALWRQTLRS